MVLSSDGKSIKEFLCVITQKSTNQVAPESGIETDKCHICKIYETILIERFQIANSYRQTSILIILSLKNYNLFNFMLLVSDPGVIYHSPANRH